MAVVDDDESLRDAICSLLRSFGLCVEAYGSAEEFLASACVEDTSCLVVDLLLPGMTGLELCRGLNAAGYALPTVLISAHDHPALSCDRASARLPAFLHKPFGAKALVDVVRAALDADAEIDPRIHREGDR